MYTLMRNEYWDLQSELPNWANIEEDTSYCERKLDFNLELIPLARLKSIILNAKEKQPNNSEGAEAGDIVAYRTTGTCIKYAMIGGYINDQRNYDIKVVSYSSYLGRLLLYSVPGAYQQLDLPDGRTMTARIVKVYKST